MIEAKIIADSTSPTDCRITTFLLTYPRFIHSELMTHRMFSRNAASSRAIPIEKVIERVMREPAGPIFWGRNQKGMQAAEELDVETKAEAKAIWIHAMKDAVRHAKQMLLYDVHKQIVNRLLEPFMHMTTLVTATEYGNFFNLRAHKDAQPEFQELAFQMLNLYKGHTPQFKAVGEWHLPFADAYLSEGLTTEQLLKIVTARAARLSYLTFEGDIDHIKDYLLHDRLAESGHWSPFEHAAQALLTATPSGNFVGWQQYRKLFLAENRRMFNAEELLLKRALR
jgi:thymidylate synthase ThyX